MTGQQPVIWVNDRLLPTGEPGIDPRDRGLTLGDGLFETMRVTGGVPQRIEAHLVRLRAGATTISLPLPWTDGELTEMIGRTLAANGLREAVVRVTISRGVPTARGLLPEPEPAPSLVIHAQPFTGYPPQLYRRGMHAIISQIRRNEHSPLANLKTLGYLDNILARRDAAAQDMDEALMLNTAGQLACATAANLFVVQDGTVLTPPLTAGVLPGTIRAMILYQLAPEVGLPAGERPLFREELERAEEAFLTSALLGVMPLTCVDGCLIGAGVPGPMALRFGAALSD